MGFVAISMKKYIRMHLRNNPTENEKDLRKRFDYALACYNKGITCSCGNSIWVIGSASVGNGCFTCITGESDPDSDYEIESALNKFQYNLGQSKIEDIDADNIFGLIED